MDGAGRAGGRQPGAGALGRGLISGCRREILLLHLDSLKIRRQEGSLLSRELNWSEPLRSPEQAGLQRVERCDGRRALAPTPTPLPTLWGLAVTKVCTSQVLRKYQRRVE